MCGSSPQSVHHGQATAVRLPVRLTIIGKAGALVTGFASALADGVVQDAIDGLTVIIGSLKIRVTPGWSR